MQCYPMVLSSLLIHVLRSGFHSDLEAFKNILNKTIFITKDILLNANTLGSKQCSVSG